MIYFPQTSTLSEPACRLRLLDIRSLVYMYLIYKKSCLLDISTLKEVENLSFCCFCFLMSDFVFCRMIIIQSFVLNLRELVKLHVLSYMILIQNLRVVSAIERVPEPT